MGFADELKNENLPAAFWDALPENGDENPDMAAINALLEESTPEERAENFKVQKHSAGLPGTLAHWTYAVSQSRQPARGQSQSQSPCTYRKKAGNRLALCYYHYYISPHYHRIEVSEG
jgi:hypothetical protein